jgi:hypothetical protein
MVKSKKMNTIVPFKGGKRRSVVGDSGTYIRRRGLGRWELVVDDVFVGFFPGRKEAMAFYAALPQSREALEAFSRIHMGPHKSR